MRRHQSIAFRTAWVITRSAADAEEAAQDGFVKAHAALPRFREGSPFRPWLLAIVANEARNRVRGAGRHVRIAQRVVEERRPDDAVPSPEAALLDSEQRDASARRDRAPPAAGPRGDHLPLPARAERGGDRRRARLSARHRQVTALARARAPAAGAGGGGGMSELEQRLTQLGRELDWPETPDLAAGGPAAPRCARARARTPTAASDRLPQVPAIALASLLVLAGGVFAAVPGVRDAVLEFFGLQGATVERRPQHPGCAGAAPAPARAAHDARARPRRARLHAARPARRRRARRRLREHARAGRRAVADLPHRAPGCPATGNAGLGLLVGEFRGDLAPEYYGKIAGETTRIERLRVDGDRAIWIEGAPHLFFYRPPDSEFAESELRLAHNVLLLERGEPAGPPGGRVRPRARPRAGALAAAGGLGR